MRSTWPLLLSVLIACAAPVATRTPTLKPTDERGDPLPRGCVSRLGTDRLRHASEVNCLVFSPDGQILASTADDRMLYLWEAGSGRRIAWFAGLEHGMTTVDFSPDGALLASIDDHDGLVIRDVATGDVVRSFEGNCFARFSPDGRYLVTGGGYQEMRLVEIDTGKEVWRRPIWIRYAACPAFSPDGSRIVAGHPDREIGLWEVETGRDLAPFKLEPDFGLGTHFSYSPDGKLIASIRFEWGSYGKRVLLWDGSTGRLLREIQGSEGGYSGIQFSPDGKRLLTWGIGGTDYDPWARVWDVEASREVYRTPDGWASVTCAVFTPDGKAIVTGGGDGRIRRWSLEEAPDEEPELEDLRRGCPVTFSPDGLTVAAPGPDGMVYLLDSITGREQVRFLGDAPIRYSADGEVLVHGEWSGWHQLEYEEPDPSWQARGPVVIRDAGTGRRVDGWKEDESLLFSPTRLQDGRWVVLEKQSHPEKDGEFILSLRDLDTGQVLRSLPPLSTLAILEDANRLVLESVPGTIIVSDLTTGEVISEIAPRYIGPWRYFQSGDRTLALEERDEDVRVWDVAEGEEWFRTGEPYGSVALSPDGRTLVTWMEEGPVHVWDVQDGAKLGELAGHENGIVDVTISPDGGRLLCVTPQAEWDPWTFFADYRSTPARVARDARRAWHLQAWRMIHLWDLGECREIARIEACRDELDYLMFDESSDCLHPRVFSPDGKLFAFGTSDTSVHVHSARDGREILRLPPTGADVREMVFSPDSTLLAASAASRTVHIWDVGGVLGAIDGGDPEVLWDGLGSEECREVAAAFWGLVRMGEEATRFLREKLTPTPVVIPESILEEVERLDDPDFQVRSDAAARLGSLGEDHEPVFREVLRSSPSPEVGARMQEILYPFTKPRILPPGNRARTMRAISVLDRIGTEEALEVLSTLADDCGYSLERNAARDALDRAREGETRGGRP